MRRAQLKALLSRIRLKAECTDNKIVASKYIQCMNIIDTFCHRSGKVEIHEDDTRSEDDKLYECLDIIDELDSNPDISNVQIKAMIVRSYDKYHDCSWTSDILASLNAFNNINSNDQMELEFKYKEEYNYE